MLVKYVTFERYANTKDFNLENALKSINEDYPSDDFKIESVTTSYYEDEVIIKISQTVPFGVEPVHSGFEFDNGQNYE